MKNKFIIYISSFLLIVLLVVGFIYYSNDRVVIKINGDKNISLVLGQEYEELGATAKLCVFNKCKDITDSLKFKEEINNNKVGNYEVLYQVEYKEHLYSKVREVAVIDDIAPVINLSGSKSIEICPGAKYKEDGYVAIDNYDGDITNKINIEKGNDYINYSVTDSSNNSVQVQRNIVQIDNIKPVITLKGDNVVKLQLNEEYKEAGVVVTDNCDEISANNVVIKNNIDTSVEGTYNVSYSVEDLSGNIGTANRTVKVIKPTDFETTKKSEYISSLESYIKDSNYNVSIGYVNLNTGYTYLYNSNVVYYGASLVKTVDALYVYEKMNYDENTRLQVEKAISVSDNMAHNNLVNLIGIENLRFYGRSLGASNFLTRSNKDYFGNTTVNDQIAIWKYLYNFINTNSKGNELKQYFINDYCNFLLFDGIPTTMHKYGYYGDYFHNVGIVYSDNPYLVVILTKHGNRGYKNVVQDLSKKIYELNQIDY